MNHILTQITSDLHQHGVRPGDILLVHASLRSLGHVPGGAETVIRALLQAVGEDGSLLMPALSYEQQPAHIHSTRHTPSNVGAIPESFRRRAGTLRSVHPTHSVCGVGPVVEALFRDHPLDRTPCGPHSPFHRFPDLGGKILMLGCGLRPNTSMHALEEYVVPPYLFGPERLYTITGWDGRTYTQAYITHNFAGWEQRYDRVADLPDPGFLRRGQVLEAESYLLEAAGLKTAVLAKMSADPMFFVDKVSSPS
jgi:aminoglycoside 3-N-acetyltransferase